MQPRTLDDLAREFWKNHDIHDWHYAFTYNGVAYESRLDESGLSFTRERPKFDPISIIRG